MPAQCTCFGRRQTSINRMRFLSQLRPLALNVTEHANDAQKTESSHSALCIHHFHHDRIKVCLFVFCCFGFVFFNKIPTFQKYFKMTQLKTRDSIFTLQPNNNSYFKISGNNIWPIQTSLLVDNIPPIARPLFSHSLGWGINRSS